MDKWQNEYTEKYINKLKDRIGEISRKKKKDKEITHIKKDKRGKK